MIDYFWLGFYALLGAFAAYIAVLLFIGLGLVGIGFVLYLIDKWSRR